MIFKQPFLQHLLCFAVVDPDESKFPIWKFVAIGGGALLLVLMALVAAVFCIRKNKLGTIHSSFLLILCFISLFDVMKHVCFEKKRDVIGVDLPRVFLHHFVLSCFVHLCVAHLCCHPLL